MVDKFGVVYSEDGKSAVDVVDGFNATEISLQEGCEEIEIDAGKIGCVKTIILPSSFTDIPSGCFLNYDSLEFIILPQTLKRIGESAFPGTLKEIKADGVLENVVVYGDDHIGVRNLGIFNIPIKSVIIECDDQIIDRSAFENWRDLVSVTLIGNINTIDNRAFANCKTLQIFKISGNCESIEAEVFSGCDRLEEVMIPANTIVADDAFDGKNTFRNKFVDLGLPSGTLWARSNFGTNDPSEMGIADNLSSFYDRGLTASMPSYGQISELISFCKWEELITDKKVSYKVTGLNGNSILFPCRSKIVPNEGMYWTKSGDYKRTYYLSVRADKCYQTNSQPCNLFTSDGIMPHTLRQVVSGK